MKIVKKSTTGWTAERLTLLRTLWLSGVSRTDIAQRITDSGMPVTPMAISVRASVSGLPPRFATAKHGDTVVISVDGQTQQIVYDRPRSPKEPGWRRCYVPECGEMFWSPHAGVRRCPRCRQRDDD